MRRFSIADFRFWIGVPAVFILALGLALLAVPRAIEAQQAGKVFSLGILSPYPSPGPDAPVRVNVIGRLRELGWVEGQNLKIEGAYGEGPEERLPQLAEDLLRRRVDVIWALGPQAALAAKRATTTVPVVFWGGSFPVELGVVSNLARPGGNVTGIAFSPGIELVGKQLEFLRQIAPAATRLAWILPAEGVGTAGYRATLEEAARGLGVELAIHVVGRSEDFDPAFAAMLAARVQAIATVGDPLTWRERTRIVEFATRNRLPSAFGMKDFARVGGLVAYATDWVTTQRQSADYIDKIFRGARPGDLPVQQPSKYELLINQGTARALGLAVPRSLLLLADEVIQQAGKVFSLGFMTSHPAPRTPEEHASHPVLRRLRELGWIEGENFKVERAHGEGREERLPQLAEDLVRRRVDVIWTNSPTSALAAAHATRAIPIVFWSVSFPVEIGLVSNLARPGGNVTGIAWSTGPELVGKQLELLRQIAPAATRLAWIADSESLSPKWAAIRASIDAAARGLGFELSRYAVDRSEDFDKAFASMLAARTQAIALVGNPLMWRERTRMVEFATRNRLPSAFGMKDYVQVGGLVSYAADQAVTWRQSADYVDKILRGARPGDLPVVQPNKYELVINQGTAKALGLTVPQSLLLLADEVIQ